MPVFASSINRIARSDLALVAGLVMAVTGVSGIWRLPYLAEQYGGATFLVVYAGTLLIIGWPLLAGQLILARGQRRDLASLLGYWAPSAWAPVYQAIGMAWLAAVAVLLAVYGVIASWLLAYTARAAGGLLAGRDAVTGAQALSAFVAEPERGLGWLLVFWLVLVAAAGVFKPRYLAAMLAGALGVAGLMALAVLLLAGGPGPVATHPLGGFGPMGLEGACQALVQAFHALALGSGLVLVLGQHRRPNASVLGPAAGVVLGVLTINAASCLAWPVLFDAPTRRQLSSVSGLLVQVPPALSGRMATTLFFGGLSLFALTTAVALFEMLVQAMTRLRRLSRLRAGAAAAGVLFILGLWVQRDFSGTRADTGHLADLLTVAAGDIVFPLAALSLATLIAIGIPRVRLDAQPGRPTMRLWLGLVRHPVRLTLIVVAAEGLGVIDWIQRFWSSAA